MADIGLAELLSTVFPLQQISNSAVFDLISWLNTQKLNLVYHFVENKNNQQ